MKGWTANPADFPEHHQAQVAEQLGEQRPAIPVAADAVPTEHEEQVALFAWAESTGWDVLQCMFAIPNGGHRFAAVAGKLKAEGVKAGVPDIFLPVSSDFYPGHNGLFIEMKRADRSNHPTERQKEWIERLRGYGYRVEVCYGFEEARRAIIDYLGGY